LQSVSDPSGPETDSTCSRAGAGISPYAATHDPTGTGHLLLLLLVRARPTSGDAESVLPLVRDHSGITWRINTTMSRQLQTI
jgi:hypothetical protein